MWKITYQTLSSEASQLYDDRKVKIFRVVKSQSETLLRNRSEIDSRDIRTKSKGKPTWSSTACNVVFGYNNAGSSLPTTAGWKALQGQIIDELANLMLKIQFPTQNVQRMLMHRNIHKVAFSSRVIDFRFNRPQLLVTISIWNGNWIHYFREQKWGPLNCS